ncbi:MAG: MFS transporter [Thermoleophilaceae bacterium]|nr:MFS transporter [Thermoleophilaceae bacterium]
MAYRSLLALGALDAAGYSLIVPVIPEIAGATGAGPATIGLLVATFPAGMIAGFWLAGRAVTRHGVRPVMLAALSLIALGSLGFVVAESLPVYFAARLVMGLGSAGLWLGVTFDTLARWPGQEYECMSRVLAAYSIGGLAGPALGAVGGVALPFTLYLALVLVAFALVLALERPAGAATFAPDRAALRSRGFRVAAFAAMFAYLVLGLMEGALPLHLAEHLSQAEIGALYVGLALIVAAGAAAAGSRRPRSMVRASVVLAVTGIAVAGAVSSVPLWIPALGLAALGVGVGATGALGLLVEAVDVGRIVTAMVVFSQAGIAGYLLGPLTGGAAAETLGYAALALVPAAFGGAVLAAMTAGPTPIQASTSGQVRPARRS